MGWSMSLVSLWTGSLLQEPFDIGPIDTLAVVDTLYIKDSHLDEIGLTGQHSNSQKSSQRSALSSHLITRH